MIEKKLENNVF